MAEQVNIASLTIDVDDVIKESAKLKKQLDGLKKEQKELTKAGEESSEQFIANDLAIRKLSKSYKDNQQFAVALESANSDLTKTMQVENKSTQELYDSRSELNKIAKNIQGNTEEEIELREQLNEAIDAQTEALRSQQSEYNSGKDSIGEYTDGINASDLSVQSLIKNSQESGGATKLLTNGLKGATAQMGSFIKASLRFIATPVGAVIAAIAAAFLLIKNAMDRNEESAAKVTKAFSGMTGIVKTLQKLLEPLGDFLIDGLVVGFELVEKGIFKALEAIQRGLEFLGLDEAAESLGDFTAKVEEGVRASKELADAQLAYDKAQRISRKTQLEYQKDAEKLRQIRDDETKSFQERIAANEKLGQTLTKQLNDELELAQKALDLANLRVKLDGETKENLDAQADALTEIADIEERITGQQSEQLTNRVSLQREAEAEILEAKKDAAAAAAEIAINSAQEELDIYIKANKSKIDAGKFFTEESLRLEKERLEGIAEQQKEFEKTRLENGIISQSEYNAAINEVDEQNRLANEELEAERREALQLQAAVDAENRLQFLEEQSATEYDALVQRLENDRLAEIAAAEKTGADVELINKKYDQREEYLAQSLNDAKVDGFGQVFDAYASILGEQTAAGKAAAIASTTISTYQAAQSSYASLAGIPVVGPALGVAAAAAAVFAGLKNVSKITSTPAKFSKGDILKGKSHANGGIPFSIGGMLGFEAEGGESIINRRSTAMFKPLLSEINAAGGGKRFANGGIAGATSSAPSSSLVDYDLLASRIAEANESLPAPVVSVEEISTVANDVQVVEDLSTM